MNKKTTGETIAFPVLKSHQEALEKYSKLTGVDLNLIVTAAVLEGIKNLPEDRPFAVARAVREFTLPDSTMSAHLSHVVTEEIQTVADGFGVSISRMIAYALINELNEIREGIRDLETSNVNGVCNVSMPAELSELAEIAVRLGLDQGRRKPLLNVKMRDGKWGRYHFDTDVWLFETEIHHLHEPDFNPPVERMSLLTFEADESERQAG